MLLFYDWNNKEYGMKFYKSFDEMRESLKDESDFREYLEQARWRGTPICPHCGCISTEHYKLKTKGEFKGLYKCKHCRERFTVTTKTMFDRTHIHLRKWFEVIFMFLTNKVVLSSMYIHRHIGVTQKTAWFMLNRIRQNMNKIMKFKDIVQIDETYVSVKRKKGQHSQGRSLKTKVPVVGFRSGSMVNTFITKDATKKTLLPLIKEIVEKGSTVVTDEWGAYNGLNKHGYTHERVNHSHGQYVNKSGFSTNGIENFWSHLKRMIFGIYRKVSAKHLYWYCAECAYRYNTRNLEDGERLALFLSEAITTLTYKETIHQEMFAF